WPQDQRQGGEVAVARGDFGSVLSAARSPAGDRVIAGYADGRVRLWELAYAPQQTMLPLGRGCGVFVGTEHRLADPHLVYEFRDGVQSTARPYAVTPVAGLVVHPDSQRCAFGRPDGTVHVWDVAARRELCSWQGHRGAVRALAGSADGKQFASAGS